MNPVSDATDVGAAASLPARWRVGRAELDESTLELRCNNAVVPIERKPLELLLWLLRRPGELVTKDEMFDALWAGRVVTESVLTKCVAKLRQALGDDAQAVLKTVHGYGYRLVGPVQRLEAAASAIPATTAALHAGESPPLRPNWRLVSRFGGARGETWLAVHRQSGEHRVLKFALDAPALARIRREIVLYRLLRDTLGPRDDIAQVLDWNLDEPPCFLEFAHCAEGSLLDWLQCSGGPTAVPLTTRLDLVARAADALAAAHSAGVLHKDIKPANLLIELAADGSPRVRLADFGSGHVLDAERLRALEVTRSGFTQTFDDERSTSGTWIYLAPEVIGGQPQTVRSDVFALGVLLYQMVVGDLRRPLAPGWERDVDDPLLRDDIAACCDQAPERRLGDAAELARRLCSLDARRSAAAQAQLERDEAARLRAAAARSRSRRGWLTALATVSTVAALATTLALLGQRQARDEAERHAAAAVAVSDYLVQDLIAAADPMVSGVPEASVRSVLASARERLSARFADTPERADAVRLALGQSLHGIGDHAAAAEVLAETVGRAGALATVRVRAALALAEAQVWLSQDEQAQAALDQAAPLLAATGSARTALEAEHSLLAGVVQRGLGDAAGALARLRPLRAHFVPADAATGDAARTAVRFLQQLGTTEVEAGEIDAALATLDEAKSWADRGFGPDHPRSLAVRSEIGQALHVADRLSQSAQVYAEAYERARATLGLEHLLTIEIGTGWAASRVTPEGLPDAAALMEELHTAALRRFGEEHATRLTLLNNLAFARGELGDRAAEQALYTELLAVQRRTIGPTHFRTLITLHNLGRSHVRAGQPTLALPLSTQAQEGARVTLGEDHYLFCVFALVRAQAFEALQQRDEARGLIAPCVPRLKAQLGEQHAHTRAAAALMGRL